MDESEEKEVKITLKDIDIPFWNLVLFLIKLAFASIPALFVVSFVMGIIFSLTGGLFEAMMIHS
jgi:hypothetical protein